MELQSNTWYDHRYRPLDKFECPQANAIYTQKGTFVLGEKPCWIMNVAPKRNVNARTAHIIMLREMYNDIRDLLNKLAEKNYVVDVDEDSVIHQFADDGVNYVFQGIFMLKVYDLALYKYNGDLSEIQTLVRK